MNQSWTFEEIIEALRPFAEEAQGYQEIAGIAEMVADIDFKITVGDLRNARAVFLKLGGKLDAVE
jgi:hypothetical protein